MADAPGAVGPDPFALELGARLAGRSLGCGCLGLRVCELGLGIFVEGLHFVRGGLQRGLGFDALAGQVGLNVRLLRGQALILACGGRIPSYKPQRSAPSARGREGILFDMILPFGKLSGQVSMLLRRWGLYFPSPLCLGRGPELASCIACHIRPGVAGMSRWSTPRAG